MIEKLSIVKKKQFSRTNMLLFKIGLSRVINKLSLISSTNLLFPFTKMVNSSKDTILLQFKRWSLIAISFDGLVFLKARSKV